jgi:hypothetical protein
VIARRKNRRERIDDGGRRRSAVAFRLLLYRLAYNLVNLFHICPNLGARRRSKLCVPNSSKSVLASATPPAASAPISPAAGPFRSVPLRHPRRQQQSIPFLASQLNSQSLVPAEPCSKSSPSGRDAELSRTKLINSTTLAFKMPHRNPRKQISVLMN